jgi:hypothetical protein
MRKHTVKSGVYDDYTDQKKRLEPPRVVFDDAADYEQNGYLDYRLYGGG